MAIETINDSFIKNKWLFDKADKVVVREDLVPHIVFLKVFHKTNSFLPTNKEIEKLLGRINGLSQKKEIIEN